MSNDDILKQLNDDADGMSTYEYIVNNPDKCIGCMEGLVDNLKRVDATGQFLASTARYLNAVAPEEFAIWISQLVEATIEKDRERRYLGSLLEAIWGADYQERAVDLMEIDNNFRRIYKRIYGSGQSGF